MAGELDKQKSKNMHNDEKIETKMEKVYDKFVKTENLSQTDRANYPKKHCITKDYCIFTKKFLFYRQRLL